MRASVCVRMYGVCGCVCVLVAVNTEVISAPTIEELMGPASNIVMAIASKVSRSDHVCDLTRLYVWHDTCVHLTARARVLVSRRECLRVYYSGFGVRGLVYSLLGFGCRVV